MSTINKNTGQLIFNDGGRPYINTDFEYLQNNINILQTLFSQCPNFAIESTGTNYNWIINGCETLGTEGFLWYNNNLYYINPTNVNTTSIIGLYIEDPIIETRLYANKQDSSATETYVGNWVTEVNDVNDSNFISISNQNTLNNYRFILTSKVNVIKVLKNADGNSFEHLFGNVNFNAYKANTGGYYGGVSYVTESSKTDSNENYITPVLGSPNWTQLNSTDVYYTLNNNGLLSFSSTFVNSDALFQSLGQTTIGTLSLDSGVSVNNFHTNLPVSINQSDTYYQGRLEFEGSNNILTIKLYADTSDITGVGQIVYLNGISIYTPSLLTDINNGNLNNRL